MRVVLLFSLAALSACASLEEERANARRNSSYLLCENLAVATLASQQARQAWAEELGRRGETCSAYAGAIAAAQQRQANALQMLQMARPQPAPVVPSAYGNLLYQNTYGNDRLCTYDKGGQKVTLVQPQLRPCPLSF